MSIVHNMINLVSEIKNI